MATYKDSKTGLVINELTEEVLQSLENKGAITPNQIWVTNDDSSGGGSSEYKLVKDLEYKTLSENEIGSILIDSELKESKIRDLALISKLFILRSIDINNVAENKDAALAYNSNLILFPEGSNLIGDTWIGSYCLSDICLTNVSPTEEEILNTETVWDTIWDLCTKDTYECLKSDINYTNLINTIYSNKINFGNGFQINLRKVELKETEESESEKYIMLQIQYPVGDIRTFLFPRAGYLTDDICNVLFITNKHDIQNYLHYLKNEIASTNEKVLQLENTALTYSELPTTYSNEETNTNVILNTLDGKEVYPVTYTTNILTVDNSTLDEMLNSNNDDLKAYIDEQHIQLNNSLTNYTNTAVADAKAALINQLLGEGAHEDLNTIGELSDALHDNKDIIDILNNSISYKANSDDLADVATSGSYNDLLDKPGLFSGNYNDLINKPEIPTVNNATLTIQKNGTSVGTFTANASSNSTINIAVPTGAAADKDVVTTIDTSANLPTSNAVKTFVEGKNYITNSGLYEANLNWGGKAITGSISPLDAAISNVHSANRFAFAKPAGITIEYSTDGSTYSTYSTTDAQKINLVSGLGQTYNIGGRSTGNTVNDKLRVTLIGSTMGLYINLRKILLNISTNYATGSNVKIEYSMYNSKTTFETIGTYSLSGWSGWNSIPIGKTYGGANDWSVYALRLTFGITGINSNQTSNNLQLLDIVGIGETFWSYPSTMAKTGHLYTYDSSQNATFPAGVTATSFTGTASNASKLNNQDASYYLNYNNLTNKPTISTGLALDGSNTMTGMLNLKASGNSEGNIGPNGIRWNTDSLPQDTAPQYICTIDGFANGGRQKWASLADLKTQLGVPTNYVTTNTSQTVSAAKTFSGTVTITGTLVI